MRQPDNDNRQTDYNYAEADDDIYDGSHDHNCKTDDLDNITASDYFDDGKAIHHDSAAVYYHLNRLADNNDHGPADDHHGGPGHEYDVNNDHLNFCASKYDDLLIEAYREYINNLPDSYFNKITDCE